LHGSDPAEIQAAAESGAADIRPRAATGEVNREVQRVIDLLKNGSTPAQKEAGALIESAVKNASGGTPSFEQT
jgi:hypothetical protein